MKLSVKDKNNHLTYNVWSGTDYSNNTADFYSNNNTISSSDEWSFKGDKSLKIISENTSMGYTRLTQLNAVIGDSFELSLKILNKTGESVALRIIEVTNSNFVDVTVPPSDSVQNISLTSPFISTVEGMINIQIITRSISELFVDDCFLRKISQ